MINKFTLPVLTTLLVLVFSYTFSQGVMFKDLSWKDAVNLAKGEHKLIFLQLQSDKCQQCNDVADAAFKKGDLGDYFNSRFISLRLDGTREMGARLAEKYAVSGFPVSLFIDENENLLNLYKGSTDAAFIYIKQANIAISRKTEIPIAIFEKEYKQGNRSPGFLESYIKKRSELKMPVDSLLDEFISVLPADSLSSFTVKTFIFDQAPMLDSRAYEFLRSSSDLGSVYKNAGHEKAIEVNNKIIVKTRNKAIAENDEALAARAAHFAKNTWGKDTLAGQKSYDYQMMEYYRLTHQLDKYFPAAEFYYDNYYMSKNLDSLKSAEDVASKNYRNLSSHDVKSMPPRPSKPGYTVVIAIKRTFDYSNALNTGAWNLYEQTSDPSKLHKALSWIKWAIDFFEDPNYLDTYAHLLYKLGQKDNAIKAEEKAIKIIENKRDGVGVNQFRSTLSKMKNNELDIYQQ